MNRHAMAAGIALAVVLLCGDAGRAPGWGAEPAPAGLGLSDAKSGADPFARPDTSYIPKADFVLDTTSVADTGVVFTLETGSRLYPEWKEEHLVHLDEPFPIGDTEYSGVVTEFLPDFRLVDGRPGSASKRLANPAVRVITATDSTSADSAWAFLNFPPHFSPRAFFTFRLKAIAGYTGDPDSTPAVKIGEKEPAAANPAKAKGEAPR